jgi:hypothetical protein
MPKINVGVAEHFVHDRLALVGDCGAARLYKDGIGSAYRCAKALAVTAVLFGVSKEDLTQHYLPACDRLEADNRIGKYIFRAEHLCRKFSFLQRAILRLAEEEQGRRPGRRAMSAILWNLFTGSAPYRSIMLQGLHLGFLARFAGACGKSLLHIPIRAQPQPPTPAHDEKSAQPEARWTMDHGALGKEYPDDACIVRQGEVGDCMFVVQQGTVEVILENSGGQTTLAQLGPGEVFGEMAIFTRLPRSATVRARGQARVLTIDQRGFMKRVHEDPSLAFRILKELSDRIQHLDAELAAARRPAAAETANQGVK